MKAIQYRGENQFYGFDKPEEPINGGRDELKNYNEQLKANLSAAKEIINPEVLTLFLDGEIRSYEYIKANVDKGTFFNCPDNIEFEYEEEDTVEDGGGCFVAGSRDVIRLKLKEEVKPSLVESQDDLIDDFLDEIDIARRHLMPRDLVEHLKSKFTITRKL